MSTDWKRFFRFLHSSTPEEEKAEFAAFSSEAFLAKSLQFVLPARGGYVAASLDNFLENLPVERLLDIDERLRSYYAATFHDWPANAVSSIKSTQMSSSVRQSLLFLAASHHSGFVREQALGALLRFPGRLTLAAALIRCADWVPAVRKVAQGAATELLGSCDGAEIVALWPLAIRLKSRERLDREWFHSCVEGWALRAESSPWLSMLLNDRNAGVRAWAFEKCLEQGISLGADLLDAAIGDPDPRIARYALRYAVDRCEMGRAQKLAEFGLGARHPIIRRESLRLLANSGVPLSRETIHKTLQDKAAGVRVLSAFLLRERYAERAVDHWRLVLDGDHQKPRLGVLVSLVESAEEVDIPRFRRWINYPNGLVRLLCLKGMTKVGGHVSDDELAELLSGTSRRVQEALIKEVRRGGILLDANRLMALLTHKTTTSVTREHLRELLRLLNLWDRLALILSIRPEGEANLLWFIAVLGDWIAQSDQYAPLGATRRAYLTGLLESRRGEMDNETFDKISGALNRR